MVDAVAMLQDADELHEERDVVGGAGRHGRTADKRLARDVPVEPGSLADLALGIGDDEPLGIRGGVHASEQFLVESSGAAAVQVEHECHLRRARVAARHVHDHGPDVARDLLRESCRA